MGDYKQHWDRCLQLIRQQVNNQHIFDVWFRDILFEKYDEQQDNVLLQVPSRYVFEYLEERCVRLMGWAVATAFKPNTKISYRIMAHTQEPAVDFLQQVANTRTKCPQFSIPNARDRLRAGLRYYLGDGYQWLPCYDEVADWMTDNRGRGLLAVGANGLGKTLICRSILPVIFGKEVATCTAREMNDRIDNLLKERCIIIDDLGKEDVEVRSYGNRRRPFSDLCDTAEEKGVLLIITTNLSTTPVNDPRYPSSIKERYGNSVVSRLRAITRVVEFEGNDMRC